VTTPATLPEEVAPAAPAEAPVVYAEVPTVPEVPVEARSVDKALEAAAPDREVTVYAWLYRNKEPCPTCPPDVKCAPCPPPYDLFAGRPLEEVRELGSAGPLLMVDFPTDRGRLSPHEVYVITGRFQQAPGGWVLKATRIARSAHAPGFDPQQPGLEP
jgi:hypothetical protein